MPVKPDSRFFALPVLRVVAPGGVIREVIALRLKPMEPATEGVRLMVRDGEEIDLLAQRFYGDDGLWWRILDANPLVYPLDIEPGDALNVPARGPATRATRARSF